METPDKICLFDMGDETVWCDSIPSDDIDPGLVVFYEKSTVVEKLRKQVAELEEWKAAYICFAHDGAKQVERQTAEKCAEIARKTIAAPWHAAQPTCELAATEILKHFATED